MRSVRGKSLGWQCILVALASVMPGCRFLQPHLDQSLLKHTNTTITPERLAEQYPIYFPDILEVQVAGQPSLSGERPVRVDGRIELTPADRIRVEGKTAAAVVELLAQHVGCPPEKVKVKVTDYRSQRIFLQGEVKGEARPVPYIGPEPVLDMLQRAGGITAGAALTNIQVVRAHVADGKAPEVFQVDLEAILEKNDHETNLRLQPFDQVYVGQSKTSCIKKCLPPWMRPLYGRLFGLSRPDDVSEFFPLLRRPGLAERQGRGYTSRRLD